LVSAAGSFSGCFDLDELAIDMGFYQEKKNVNQSVTVIFRPTQGVVCLDDETVVNRWVGDKVTFNIRIDRGYIYVGNTGGAELRMDYGKETGKLVIESVKAPTTIDVQVINKNDVYYIDIQNMPETVTVEYLQGSQWSIMQEEVIIMPKLPDNYVFKGWSIGGTLKNGGYMLCETEYLVYTPEVRGENKIYMNIDVE
jgi:hypothetical protein